MTRWSVFFSVLKTTRPRVRILALLAQCASTSAGLRSCSGRLQIHPGVKRLEEPELDAVDAQDDAISQDVDDLDRVCALPRLQALSIEHD